MLTTLSTQQFPRTGRPSDTSSPPSSDVSKRARGEQYSKTATDFRKFLISQQVSADARSAGNRMAAAVSATAGRTGAAQAFAAPITSDSPYNRGGSGSPIPPSAGFVMPMQHTYQGPAAMVAEHPVSTAYNQELRVPDASMGSSSWYIGPGEVIGATAPRTTGEGANAVTFASNVYRVPSWGVQDFVTSDGMRHRFDVEVVFRDADAEIWTGGPVDAIHPEVGALVLNSLRTEIEAAGIPDNALESARVYRAHGGPSVRPWYLDQMELVRADGERFQTSMNTFMRDPQYSMKVLKEFLSAEIPT